MVKIAKLRDERDVEGLVKALRHRSPKIRRAAALALGWLGEAGAEDPLLEALGDESVEVQRAAAEALYEFPNRPGLTPDLVRAYATTGDPSTRSLLKGLLAHLGARDDLLSVMRTGDQGLRRVAADILMQMALTDQDVVDGFVAALADDDPTVRRLAAESLGWWGGTNNADVERAMAPLRGLVDDQDDTVRKAAAKALEYIGTVAGGVMAEDAGQAGKVRVAILVRKLAEAGPTTLAGCRRVVATVIVHERANTTRVGSRRWAMETLNQYKPAGWVPGGLAVDEDTAISMDLVPDIETRGQSLLRQHLADALAELAPDAPIEACTAIAFSADNPILGHTQLAVLAV